MFILLRLPESVISRMSVGASFLRREHSVRVVLSALCTACSKQFYRGWTTKAEIQFVQGAGRASKSRTMIWSKIIKQEKPRRNSSPWMLSLLLCVLCRASMPIFALGWRTSSASILYVGNIFLYAACIGWLLAGRGMQAQPGRRGADALWTYRCEATSAKHKVNPWLQPASSRWRRSRGFEWRNHT